MLDPYALLGMTTLMLLLETIDLLVTFTQKRDVYVCNFIVALKIAERKLFTLFVDKSAAYSEDEFWAFKNILDCSHNQIHMKWISDLNDESAQIVFVVNSEKNQAVHVEVPVDRKVLSSLVAAIKTECISDLEPYTFLLKPGKVSSCAFFYFRVYESFIL